MHVTYNDVSQLWRTIGYKEEENKNGEIWKGAKGKTKCYIQLGCMPHLSHCPARSSKGYVSLGICESFVLAPVTK